ncbi:MAG: 23S rRNA (guanosine(2251)-2'-O)-methyltransferase RlmB [Firmicutes bacterium]|nr:23S rRNA (guanosine(2251)-2'-O)-methyltransferase RlmB [Bacillota bacterium]
MAERGGRGQAQDTELLCGRNAVLEALKSGRSVNKVWLADNNDPAFAGAVFRLCQQAGVPCHKLPRTKLDRLAGPDHRGVAAELAALAYAELEDILQQAADRGEQPFVILLDQVEDPHNLGAVIRTALCAGAHGVVVPKRRAAALNQTVVKTSAGAANYLPVARVANLNQALDRLKQAGCWAVAADMDGQPMWDCDLTGPMALVLGGEGAGVSPLLKKNCDLVAAIPMQGSLGSLNVSNAGAVLMYEILRQRTRK